MCVYGVCVCVCVCMAILNWSMITRSTADVEIVSLEMIFVELNTIHFRDLLSLSFYI